MKLTKVLAVILSVAMLLCIMPLGTITVGAATSGITGDCTWTLDGTVLTISGNGKMFGYSSLSSLPWGTSITKVIIEDGVTSIGSYAFYNCSRLTSITIPDSVTSIGSYSFSGTAYYNGSYNWENKVLYIGNCLIKAKTNISGAYTIKSGTKAIADEAFSSCDSLTSITIPDGVTSIGSDAFSYCSSLTSITIPGSVISIGGWAFYDCSSLTSITIHDSVTSIGRSTFSGCSSLTNITIPDSVTSVGSGAFRDCSSLTSITIPDSVTSIGDSAFYGCSSLTSITIPDSVTSIGAEAFYGTKYYKDSSKWENNVLYIGNHLIKANTDISSNYAIKSGTITIADYAFSGCSSLISITIPDGVESLGYRAFLNCSSLTSITIPNSVTSISTYAFSSCSSLTSITVNANNAYYSSINGVLFNKDKTEILRYPIGKTESFYTIPKGITSIGNSAFENCSSLISITIPDGVESLGHCAFCGCSSLTSIAIPDSVTSIDHYAFLYSSLETVYYCGTVDQWKKISMGEASGYLTSATRYYHNISDWLIRIEPTCTENGEKYRACSFCGYEETEVIQINPDNHNYISGKCENCNSYIESKHDYDTEYDETWVISNKNTVSITITFSEETYVEQKYDFIYIYDGNDNEIGKYTGGELASKSVTVLGDTAKIRIYSDRINTAYGFKITNIEFACAHNYITETKSVTCIENGYKKHTCEYCGDVYYTDEVVALGHKYTSNIKEPICIEGGYTIHTCENCGDSYIDGYTDATGIHIYENGNCIQCNGYLESEHEYAVEFDETWTIHRKGATSITITFSSDTFVEQKYDFIYIYDGNDNEVGKYTGGELASKSITVSGDTAKIRLYSDRIGTAYGFKLTDISAEYAVGDINTDGDVNVLDFILFIKALADMEENDPNTPDLDGNGISNIYDLIMLKKYLLGILKF